jgi:hypothetical protein
MIRNRTHIILLFSLGFFSIQAFAQGRAKTIVDRTTILVGEPIIVRIEAAIPAAGTLKWPSIDTIPHFEIIDKSAVDSSSDASLKTFRQQLTITSYDSGYWSIPSYTMQAGKQRIRTDTIAINVTYSPADPNQPYHDIKEIIPVEKPSNNLLYWLLGAITLLFAIAAYFYLRKKKAVPLVEEQVSKVSPYEEAMQALKELEQQSPVDQPSVKTYFTRLNDVLRVYLKRRFNYSTLEKTNEELILQLRNSKLRGEEFTRLAQALRMNDFIKFAKYTPTAAEKTEVFNQISQSIKLLEELNKSA